MTIESFFLQKIKNFCWGGFRYLNQEFCRKLLELFKQKGFQHYVYIGAFEKFDEGLPEKGKFFSSLIDRHISDKETSCSRYESLITCRYIQI